MSDAGTLAYIEAKEKSQYVKDTVALEAGYDLFTGSFLSISSDAGLVIIDPRFWRIGAIGMARRDIAKAEMVAYNPNESTVDICIMIDVQSAELKEILRKHNAEFCKCGHEIGFGNIAWNNRSTEYGTEYSTIQIQCEACQTEIAHFHSWTSYIESNDDLLDVLRDDWTNWNSLL